METQGQRIRHFREKAQLTLDDLGKAIGTTKQNIYKYENDIVTNIPYDKVLAMSKTLNVEPWEILGWPSPKTKIFELSEDSTVISIPVINQKLSAGPGSHLLSSEDITVRKIDILSTLARGVDRSTLAAAEVEGDSMIGEKICSGDLVVFSRGLVKGDGIYVISYGGDVLVKRIEVDAVLEHVNIISANPAYPVKSVPTDCVGVIGKVVGVVHAVDY